METIKNILLKMPVELLVDEIYRLTDEMGILEIENKELKKQLLLHNVSQQSELLAFIEEVSTFDALVSSTRLRLRAKELLKANCG